MVKKETTHSYSRSKVNKYDVFRTALSADIVVYILDGGEKEENTAPSDEEFMIKNYSE